MRLVYDYLNNTQSKLYISYLNQKLFTREGIYTNIINKNILSYGYYINSVPIKKWRKYYINHNFYYL